MNTSAVEQSGLVARLRHIFTALPVAAILLLAIVFGTSSYMHSQMLSLGQSMWSNYGMVRADMRAPTCDPNFDVEARVEKQMQKAEEQAEDSLLAFQAPNPDNLRRSLARQLARCQEQHQLYEYNQQMRESPWVRAYTRVEHSVGELNEVGLDARKYLLITIILLCAVISTLRRSHISLRAIQTRTEGRVSALLQLVGNGLLLASALSWRSVATKAGDTTPMAMHLIWITGFAALTLINAVQCLRSQGLSEERTSIGKALLTVPLYTYMALIAGTYFILSENYVAGNAVQLIKLVSHADLYINVGLYVWVGMLLKQTRLAKLVFDAIRPWQLAPELIVVVTVLLAAYPTAFTGASGIFLIAVGGIIYEEIRLSGARRPLAYASTAMSGSMGVVLNPCLMVVVIASLNKQVTTTQLYGMGVYVFMLTAILFALMVLLTKRNPLSFAPPREALPASLRALVPLVPYVLIGVLVVVFYNQVVNQRFNEFTAATILPVIMLFILLYDAWASKREARQGEVQHLPSMEGKTVAGFWQRTIAATSESSTHIGALLLLMALSVVLGGVVERAGLMELFPSDFSSIWLAMTTLVIVLVLIGMFMDPYGAIILVSATIASVAYDNNIDPVHFWMVVLVSFELGYLTPPVALNQLLTRQVIGNEEMQLTEQDAKQETHWWYRHERLLLPLTVMLVALLLVAYVPLMMGVRGA